MIIVADKRSHHYRCCMKKEQCLGSKCMAWQWDYTYDCRTDKRVYSNRRGYCGAVKHE